jgi:hypothetical protein
MARFRLMLEPILTMRKRANRNEVFNQPEQPLNQAKTAMHVVEVVGKGASMRIFTIERGPGTAKKALFQSSPASGTMPDVQ